MANDEHSTSDVDRLVRDFTAPLRATTDWMENLARFLQAPSAGPGGAALPGALSAAQMTSIADSIAAQRHSIEALKAQLSAFDEQLAVLEQILAPLAEWSRAWADLEQRLLAMGPKPQAGRL